MLSQANALKRRASTLATLVRTDARQRKRELHVLQDGLVRDEVIALEHEADTMVAVGVPVGVGIVLGRDAVHHDIARIGVVKAAKDIEEGGLSRARGAKHGHELAWAEGDGDAVECPLNKVARRI